MSDDQTKPEDQTGPEKPKRKRVLTPEQKERRKAYQKEYKEKNKDKIQKRQSEYAKAHREQNNARNKRWAANNKEKVSAKNRAWYKKNKDYALAKAKEYNARDDVKERKRDWTVGKLYGIDMKTVYAMIEDQESKCKCCNTPFGLLKGTRQCVDHCHATGLVRGILCLQCNWLLGHAHDNPEVLRRCADYLEAQGISKGVANPVPRARRKKGVDDGSGSDV